MNSSNNDTSILENGWISSSSNHSSQQQQPIETIDSTTTSNRTSIELLPHQESSLSLVLAFNYYILYEDKLNFWKDLIILLLYSMTAIVSVFGNLIVCYTIFVLRTKSTTYLLIGNMAISDLISGFVIPLQWVFCSTSMLDWSERLCGGMKTLQVISYYISTFTMAVIAIDRYTILTNPLNKRIDPLIAILVIWGVSFLINIFTLISMRATEYFTPTKMIHCRIIAKTSIESLNHIIRKYRVLFLIMIQYVLPLTIASWFYILCIKKILLRQQIGESTNEQRIRFYQRRMRTIKMLLISLCAFIVGWFPVHLVHFIDFYVWPLLAKQCNSSFYYNLFYWIAISSCCYNPFIYCWFDEKFRSSTRKLFLYCCCCGMAVRQQVTTTNQKAETSLESGSVSSTKTYRLQMSTITRQSSSNTLNGKIIENVLVNEHNLEKKTS